MLTTRSIVLAGSLLCALPLHAVELSAAINAAQAADPSLASALANRDVAAENIAIARSRLLPQVSMQATEQQIDQTTKSALGTTPFRGRSRNGQLSIRQALFRPRDWRGLEIGRLQAEYGEYKLASAQADLWSRTSNAWVDLFGAVQLSAIYVGAVESAGRLADQEKRRFEKGDGTRDAMIEASAQAAQVRAQLAESRSEVESRRSVFKLLTRLDPTGFESYRVPAPDALPSLGLARDEMLDRIVGSYPELQAYAASARISELKLSQTSADHLPTVDLIASAAEAANDTTNTLGTSYRNQQVGLQVVIPIYQGGGVSASERQAAASLVAAWADKDVAEQKVRSQFTADWQTLEGLRERMAAARELIASAIEQRRAADLGMKAGLRSWTEAAQADQMITRRQADLVNMITTYLHTQARMLSLLPTTDEQWDRWTREVWKSVQR